MLRRTPTPARSGRPLALALCVAALALVILGPSASQSASGRPEAGSPPAGTYYYSTASPPGDYPGPGPVVLAMAEIPSRPVALDPAPALAPPSPPARESSGPSLLVAVEPPAEVPPTRPEPAPELAAPKLKRVVPPERPTVAPEADPIVAAKAAIAQCRVRFAKVQDYSCTFYKRERMPDGRLTAQHVLAMKFRVRPFSVYLKFQKPNAGREAIFVAGRNNNRAYVHDVGLGKLLAGTMSLDPRSKLAMEDCRHPITEAGLGHMIEEIAERWEAEMRHGETQVTISKAARVGNRLCTSIESTHPQHHPKYLFHKVRVFIDQEHGLPIRFEAYDWPRRPGAEAPLVEEYTYSNLRVNTGLGDADFDPSNSKYSFGRF